MTLQERIAGIQTLLDAPPTSEDYKIYPGEIPWWEIDDPVEKAKARYRQWYRIYMKLHPERQAKKNKRFYEMHPSFLSERIKLRRKTPKGIAKRAKMTARRREQSTNPELYAARVELLHTIQESCAKCYTPYKITHQVDHILALCLGGIDSWDNLQPLCILCHREKTKEDIQKFALYQNEQAAIMIARAGNMGPWSDEERLEYIRR